MTKLHSSMITYLHAQSPWNLMYIYVHSSCQTHYSVHVEFFGHDVFKALEIAWKETYYV